MKLIQTDRGFAVASKRHNEAATLAALQDLKVLDSAPEAEFDALVKVASVVCGVPISILTLVDSERQWFKASVGVDGLTGSGRDEAFCSHAVLDDRLFEVPDLALDPRFSGNPLVAGPMAIRFYAGAPIVLDGSHRIGTLCVVDQQPHVLSEAQRQVLEQLALAASKALRVRREAMRATESKQALAVQHELFRVTLQSIGDAVITTDARGNVVWVNPTAERVTGWTNPEATGRPLREVFRTLDEDTRRPLKSPLLDRQEAEVVDGLARFACLVAKVGVEIGVEYSVSPMRNESRELLGWVLVFRDVSQQRRMAKELAFRASHDELTGLANRTEFEERLKCLFEKAHDESSENALLYLDLDQFKLVNDACGHRAGDQLLQQVGKLLERLVRVRDTVARLGGDEFAILLERCSTEDAQRVAQNICDAMDDFRFAQDQRRFRIGVSIGLVPVDSRWASIAAILQAADASCYAAKDAGRNRVHAWYDSDRAMKDRHDSMQLASRIEQAIDEDRFVLFGQRIVPLTERSDGLHAEFLVRMIEGDKLIPPGAFLPAAERFNMACRIDRWVLRRSIEWMRALPAIEDIGLISVNLSGQSVGDPAFHRWAIGVLAEAGSEVRKRLCLEVTETAAVTNLVDAALFIDQIRAAGVRVALDDFGAGASSFGYLKHLTVDFLKIDGQFVRDVVTDPLDDAAVRCFVDVAGVMGVKTIAEFVDKPEVFDRLREIGVDFAQGYLLHVPEPVDALLAAQARDSSPRQIFPSVYLDEISC